MSIPYRDMDDGAPGGASQLLARAAAAEARGRRRLAAAIDDFFLPDDARLDDRMRATIALALTGLVATIESTLAQHAARLLAARGVPEPAEALARGDAPVLDRLVAAGLLRDSDLMREMIARVRQDVIGDALPAAAPPRADMPSLLTRLASHADSVVAAAASALFAADGLRRGLIEGSARTDLPAELHHRLVWWVAAALRERFMDHTELAAIDRALAEAAVRSLAAHDESERLEAAAMRLAAAYQAAPAELPALLVEALGDRRIALFTGLLAHGAGLDYDLARQLIADPYGGQLWIVLRALNAGRGAIARIGLALSDADPRRDLEAFADTLDAIMAVAPEAARAALAPMTLHTDYRAALSALTAARQGGRA